MLVFGLVIFYILNKFIESDLSNLIFYQVNEKNLTHINISAILSIFISTILLILLNYIINVLSQTKEQSITIL